MKKTLIIIAIIITILSINKEPQQYKKENTIRFRVIANSNSQEDQLLKRKIVENLSLSLKDINNSKTIDETRSFLKRNLPSFQKVVEKTIEENDENRDFHINYGKNYFPKKQLNNTTFKEGEYESLVITLGEGEGDNFWCILFPPLCFTDEYKNVEYKSFIKELFDKYF